MMISHTSLPSELCLCLGKLLGIWLRYMCRDKEENGNLYFFQTKAINMLVFHACNEVIWPSGLILTSLHLKQLPSVAVHVLCTSKK